MPKERIFFSGGDNIAFSIEEIEEAPDCSLELVVLVRALWNYLAS